MSGAGAAIGGVFQDIGNIFAPPKAPAVQAPNNAVAPPPNPADASTQAISRQLANEKQMAASSPLLTGGQGLLDEPKTLSPTLLGS